MNDQQRQARIDEARAEAARLRADPSTPRKAYWLSFADSSRPEGEQFLGGCLVDDVVSAADAIEQSHRRKCNPGGEVLMCEVPIDEAPPDFPRNTLLDKEQLTQMGGWKPMPRPDY